jgi:predicted adenylyl cyclase CyaB
MRNLEIKIQLTDERLAELERRVRGAGLPVSVLTQVDTYFAAREGRLKLREIRTDTGERSDELISYHRPNHDGPRWSRYERLALAPEAGDGLKRILTDALGVRSEVQKRRLVAIRGRSRIHLDRVEGLGCFLEIETVAAGDDDAGIDQELRATVEWLGVDLTAVEPVRGSYADLQAEQQPERQGEPR